MGGTEKFMLVTASSVGPVLWKLESLEMLAQLLVSWARAECSPKCISAWKRGRGRNKWVPLVEWGN